MLNCIYIDFRITILPQDVFRIGPSEVYCGEPGHPSLYIVDSSEKIEIAIENAADCWGNIMDPYFYIQNGKVYSIVIHYNETWSFISINKTLYVYNAPPRYPQTTRFGELASVLLGVAQYPTADVTLFDMLMVSYDTDLDLSPYKQYTKTPTNNPTKQPSTIRPNSTLQTKLTNVSVNLTDYELDKTATDNGNVLSVFNFDSVSMIEIVIGVFIMFGCCLIPTLVGICICYFLHQRKKKIDIKPDIVINNGKGKIELNVPRAPGLANDDSIKMKPGLNDNYTLTATGLTDYESIKLPDLQDVETLNIEGLKKKEEVLLDVSSNKSEEMYKRHETKKTETNKVKLKFNANDSILSDGMYENHNCATTNGAKTKKYGSKTVIGGKDV